jgi:3-phosphoshikimate 1-carboxyvinyltransferase
MLAPLADGTSRIRGLATGADVRSTAAAMRALGVESSRVPGADEYLELSGPVELRSPGKVIDCGNSGTTARLLLGLMAGHSIAAALDGDASLRRRPMARVMDPLSAAGAEFRERGEPGRLPLQLMGGALRPIEHKSEVASAQVKSALLLAGLAAGVPATISEPGPSRDHTERMLRAMGARVETELLAEGFRVRFEPAARPLLPLDTTVPGDFSSAAFWLALAVLGGCGDGVRIEGVGLNGRRTGLLRVLEAMGASVETRTTGGERAGEPVGEIVARPSALRGIEVPPEWLPTLLDEIPVLAIVAARAEGSTRIRGATELRVKESDRIANLCRNLSAVGVPNTELPDGLEIEGTWAALSGHVTTEGDHRIAMAFGALGALDANDIDIDDRASVEVSYPGFWDELARVVEQTEAR